jgi:hypothetical protein
LVGLLNTFHIHTFLILQVIKKRVDIDYICEHRDISEAWANDKFGREASFLTLGCVMKQLLELTGTAAVQWKLPTGMVLLLLVLFYGSLFVFISASSNH